jgi:hypothetical protein
MKVGPIIKQQAISSLAKLLADGATFERVKNVVIRQDNNPEMTNAQKRSAALYEMKVIGLQLVSWLANLILELAVAWLRQEQSK